MSFLSAVTSSQTIFQTLSAVFIKIQIMRSRTSNGQQSMYFLRPERPLAAAAVVFSVSVSLLTFDMKKLHMGQSVEGLL